MIALLIFALAVSLLRNAVAYSRLLTYEKDTKRILREMDRECMVMFAKGFEAGQVRKDNLTFTDLVERLKIVEGEKNENI